MEHPHVGEFLKAMRIPKLSQNLKQRVLPVDGYSGSESLDPHLTDCLLALQRFLAAKQPVEYGLLEAGVREQVQALK